MADDSRQRSLRTDDPYRRGPEPARPSEPAAGSDPLAELARLIGQSDPFAEFGRSNARQTPPARQAPQAYQAPPVRQTPQAPQAPQAYRTPQDDYAQPDDDLRHDDYAQQVRYQERYAEPSPAPRDDWSRDLPAGHDARGALRHSDYEQSQLAPDQAYADDAYTDHRYAEQAYADHPADARDPDAGQPLHHDAAQGMDAQPSDPYYEHAPLEPQEDETYDDAPRARQRGGLATALALIGCAMLGTAGAYAYRSYVSNPTASLPPPVITADNSTPTKIVPATAGDPGKAIQDRVATAGKEQIISKQEEPVALRELGTQSTPRVVLPAPVSPTPAQSMAPPTTGSTTPVGSEPKKVRTVVIRPDGTDVSGRPVGAMPAPATTASTRATATTTPPAPRATAPAATSGTRPLSLDPQTGEPVPTAPAPRTRTAAATTGYVVQLSSQKTEAEAQASFRALQSKFPNELGGRDPIIRRADLGNKGVFYRTMVGPFGSSQEAGQFCASYKAAGGQCVVPTTN
jgi:hypothetical protein